MNKLIQLIKDGADPNLTNKNGDTPLMQVIKTSYDYDTIFELAKLTDLSIQNKDGNTALMLAILRKFNPTIPPMIINVQKSEIVYNESKYPGQNIYVALMDSKSINLQNKNGDTALMIAAIHLDVDLCTLRLFIDHLADPNIRNKDGNTALMKLCKYDHHSINIATRLKCLIEGGTNLDIADSNYNTALLLLTRYYKFVSPEYYQIFLDHNVNLERTDKDCNTALMLAIQSQHGTMDHLECIKLLAHDPSINVCNKDGNTALMLAVMYNDVEVIPYLCKIGANVNSSNDKNDTVLLAAVKLKRDYNIIKYLIKSGADVNARDTRGNTFMHYMVHYDK